jgi:2-methylisocitrate lyase-like PEP mutase family enzyme
MAGSPIEARRAVFRQLHERGCFLIPNPWDVGSAVYLQRLGFKALASTSSGFAFTLGLPDHAVSRDVLLVHLEALCAAVDVPISADFENGFADDTGGVHANVRLALETGVAGLSIEDGTEDASSPLYEFSLAVERIKAARAAFDAYGAGAILTARTEGFLVGRPDLDEATERLKAYAAAGADCLYAPGIRTIEQIDAIVAAVTPKPVNVLMSSATGLTVASLAARGVRRISVGSALARVAWGAMIRSATQMLQDGEFGLLGGAVAPAEINGVFRR